MLQLETEIKKLLVHYSGVIAILLVIWFAFGPALLKLEDIFARTHSGPTVTVSQSTPSPGLGQVANDVAKAEESAALAAAIKNQALQLSYAQQAVSNVFSDVGHLNHNFSNGLAGALTTPNAKRQVITVGTKVTVTPPPSLPSDDVIKRDMKEVLSSTTIHADTKVQVSWQDAPQSPFFAVFASNGASGIGYAARRSPGLTLDALLLNKSGQAEAGIGIDHQIKGTAASLGVAATYNVTTHKTDPQVFVGFHW